MNSPAGPKVGHPASGLAKGKGGEHLQAPRGPVANRPYPLWTTYFPEEGCFIYLSPSNLHVALHASC